ncbi:MAG: uroporphyrinogen decarboxylase family protein [Puniceicoccaceae bacterium]
MNSRRRILNAIRHEEPDQVPVDLGSTPSSGISAIAYGNLKRHIGINTGNNRVYDVVQQLAQPEDEILDRFGIDVVDLGRSFNTSEEDWYPVRLSDGNSAQYPNWFRPVQDEKGTWRSFDTAGTEIAIQLEGMDFYDQSCFPWLDDYPADMSELPAAMSKVHWAALAHSPWDHSADPDFWETLRENAISMRASTDRALMVVVGCNLFEWGTFVRRMDNFLMDLIDEPEEVERFLDPLMEIHMRTLEKVCNAVGDVVDVCRFGDDLGMTSGPFMSPRTYRELFKPRHARLCDYVKKHSSMHTFLHSCGSIHALLPDLIEAGFDVINPVQTNCLDMEPDRLKKDFGKDICFWGGGVDTRSVLNKGTPEDVRNDVLNRLEIFSPGGGFVFNTVHNILPDVPPQNVVAMFEAIDEFNKAGG